MKINLKLNFFIYKSKYLYKVVIILIKIIEIKEISLKN